MTYRAMRQVLHGVMPVLQAPEAAAGGGGGEADGVGACAVRRHRHVLQHADTWRAKVQINSLKYIHSSIDGVKSYQITFSAIY